jgi:hypothetical protein
MLFKVVNEKGLADYNFAPFSVGISSLANCQRAAGPEATSLRDDTRCTKIVCLSAATSLNPNPQLPWD